MPIRRSSSISSDTVESFAQRLTDFAAGLSEREAAILGAIVAASRQPLDRMRERAASEVLSPGEQVEK